MNVEQIDSSRIIISLCNKDMENFSVTFESLNLSDIHSKKVIKQILYYASSKTGISLENKKVLIEAMKYENGCILLITFADKNKKRKTYYIKKRSDYIFMFDNVNDFLDCIKAVYQLKEKRYLSSAFLLDNKYYLAIQPTSTLKNRFIQTIKEFSSQNNSGKFKFEILKEHAFAISEFNAVETIGQKL